MRRTTYRVMLALFAHGRPKHAVCVCLRYGLVSSDFTIVECRRQKMKCEPQRHGPCKRCRNSKTECVFIPRANARQPDASISPGVPQSSEGSSSEVMARLSVIESMLGISSDVPISPTSDTFSTFIPITTTDPEENESGSNLSGLWQATADLKRFTAPKHMKIWSRRVVSQLWSSFHTNTEGLHFQSEQEASKNPTPLLLAAILYVSSLRHTSDQYAAFAPEYFRATCSAIAELSIPAALKSSGPMAIDETLPTLSSEQAAYHNVLGLIIAGLISEAFIDLTGIWISIGYRLILDHCPVYVDHGANKWRQLFSGLQIIDLEHASLHLTCTIVPMKAPLPSLRQMGSFAEDPFNRLTEIMHTGLSHFTGRGLPTIWSFISSSQAERPAATVLSFTDRDVQVIKRWANSLDDWLACSNGPNNTDHDRVQIRRQYNLHRLLVLSIYHPARGFDLFADTVATAERQELLLSARATLRLQKNDDGIWANWDLVMITWAAILVLQGAEGGVGEHDDLLLVQDHLNKLQSTKRPAPSLHHTLADRLETWLQSMNTPPSTALTLPDFDLSWTLFDQSNMVLTSTSVHEQDTVTLAMNGKNTMEASLDHSQQQAPNDPEFWNAYSSGAGSWPSGFTRLFGHPMYDEMPNNGNQSQ
ncbi:hypothetical protein FB567DRAFT_177989 [Paraphoma chrysanthemicola]|uniref:Zn(2)-C6 fungal-type domain-containing protein n=1 Tax=Paraphoma chrysanthemicola TaxID=798071 RepID=A0A8K0W3B6_9PLEO|nr:hypothetical protein FB567DRAFT_177989 [Paraphoma chrysanthemicola]